MIYKIRKHLGAFYCMQYFRMELDSIQFLLRIFRCRYRTVCCFGTGSKSRCYLGDVVKMTHPADRMLRYILEQCAVFVYLHICFSVLADWCFFHLASQYMHHQLGSVAQSQNRNAHLKQFLGISRCPFFIATVRTTCQNDSLRIHFLDLCQIGFV